MAGSFRAKERFWAPKFKRKVPGGSRRRRRIHLGPKRVREKLEVGQPTRDGGSVLLQKVRRDLRAKDHARE